MKTIVATKQKADISNPAHIGASMSGTVVKVIVEKGDKVSKGDHLMITEAMKMETTVQAPFDVVIKQIHVVSGDGIQPGVLLIELQN